MNTLEELEQWGKSKFEYFKLLEVVSSDRISKSKETDEEGNYRWQFLDNEYYYQLNDLDYLTHDIETPYEDLNYKYILIPFHMRYILAVCSK